MMNAGLAKANEAKIRGEDWIRSAGDLLREALFCLEVTPSGDWVVREVLGEISAVTGLESAQACDPSRWRDFIHPEDLEKAVAASRQMLTSREPMSIEIRLLEKNGQARRLELSARHASGRADAMEYFIVGVLRDVTACVRVEAAAKARDEHLAIVAHDLRSPLSALLIQVENMRMALCKKRLGLENVGIGLALIDRLACRLVRLVDRLLESSCPDSRFFKLRKQRCDLDTLLRDVCGRFAPQLDQVCCRLHVVTQKLAVGTWDSDRIEQIIENLLSNIVKFAPGCSIQINMTIAGNYARLVMEDEGHGISPDQLGRIFQLYERGKDSSDTEGMGLGLYIARQIAQAHGGTLVATCEPGKGALFTLELPLD